jgi:hypothetical protein
MLPPPEVETGAEKILTEREALWLWGEAVRLTKRRLGYCENCERQPLLDGKCPTCERVKEICERLANKRDVRADHE